MRVWQRLAGMTPAQPAFRSEMSVDDWILYNGHTYPLGLGTQTLTGDREDPPDTFESFVIQMYAANPIVFTAMTIRRAVFSQAVFKYVVKATGKVVGGKNLSILEEPRPFSSTKGLLNRMITHSDGGGNAYVLDVPRANPRRLHLMRPDYVSIVMGSQLESDRPGLAEDAELVGYLYTVPGSSARLYFPEEVGHFAPIPDPLATFRGMSWLTPIVREVMGDKLMSAHKIKFFEQGATPNIIIRFDPSQTINQVKAFKELVEENAHGIANAYRTLYIGGGADATVVGSDLNQLDFSATVGKAETRILMAAGVHAAMAGASEGLAGSALNAGNFTAVRRMFSDIHLQDLWAELVSALNHIARPPKGQRLTVDGSRIPFLQDDKKDEAEIQLSKARAITQLTREGYTWESAIAAIQANDFGLLKHSGLFSVQLQALGAGDDEPPGSDVDDDDPDAEGSAPTADSEED